MSSSNSQDPEAHVRGFKAYSSPCFAKAFDAMDDEDPAKHIAGWFSCVPQMPIWYNSAEARAHMDVHASHSKLIWMVDSYGN